MIVAALKGDWATARELHLKMFKLARAMFIETNPIPIKTAMAVTGMMAEEFRLPMCEMQPATRDKLLAAMKEYGLKAR
jgi:4-hydroxy-tetrahydrodipicolinate synthase